MEVRWSIQEDNIKVGVKDVEVVTTTKYTHQRVFIYLSKRLMKTVPYTYMVAMYCKNVQDASNLAGL